jgi:hypothetical protein
VQYFCDRGGQGFQAIQNGVSPDGELLPAELAAQVLDGFVLAMRAKPNLGMKAFISQQVVIAKRVGAEVTLGCQ